MDNGSALLALADLPSCTPWLVPFYAPRGSDREIVDAIAHARPGVLIWSSANWFTAIDSRSAGARLPLAMAWLDRRYPYAMRVGNVVLRFRQRPLVAAPKGHGSSALPSAAKR